MVKINANIVACIDPDISSISVTDITQTSVRVSWSTGQTQVVNSIVVYYRTTGATSWNTRSVSQSTTGVTMSALHPGTQYQFYVKISSYGKSSTSNTVTVTTGKLNAARMQRWIKCCIRCAEFIQKAQLSPRPRDRAMRRVS